MTPSTAALARRVRALLAEPERWTQTYLARDANGVGVNTRDPRAACWCLMGAISHVLNCEVGKAVEHPLWWDLTELTGTGPAAWNDAPGRTHADVLALLDRVIAEGESREPSAV